MNSHSFSSLPSASVASLTYRVILVGTARWKDCLRGSGRKLYSITAEGKAFLKDNKAIVDAIFARMEDAASFHKRAEAPQIVRAIQNLRFTLKLKTSRGELTDKQIRAIAETIDDAARKIEQC